MSEMARSFARDTKVRCREIRDDDIESMATVLARGFHARSREHWLRGLRRQQTRCIPHGYPRFGYMLETDTRPVGVMLVMYTAIERDGRSEVQCNVASWFVEDEFRGHAPRLAWAGLRHKNITYTDITPAVATWPVIERLGFKRYCNGLHLSLPCLSKRGDAQIEHVAENDGAVAGVTMAESQLLLDHLQYGCVSMVCHTPRGAEPFIFLPFRIRQGRYPVPAMRLIYCRDLDSYARCAGTLGREFARRGKPVLIANANGPIAGLPGLYTEQRGRKYFRGPKPPLLTDLTNTELVLFGI